MNGRTKLLAALCVLLLGSRAIADDTTNDNQPQTDFKALSAAREQGLEWLTKHQAADGSWGKTYTFAVTSFACLSYLGAADEPYTGEHGRALLSGLRFLLANQQDGQFRGQGHTWIHGQGFATLEDEPLHRRGAEGRAFVAARGWRVADQGLGFRRG